MTISVIIATRNRARDLAACLDSIAVATAAVRPRAVEIVVADNGSSDETAAVIAARSGGAVPVVPVAMPVPGKARALNAACAVARGDILVFTDDDCRLRPDHLLDVLRLDAADDGLVLRGGRIELGNEADLPFTINLGTERQRWSRAGNAARTTNLAGHIAGCNMTMRRALYDRVGPFDVDFGPGSVIGSGEDTDYVYRAYLAGAVLEYVPAMVVYHHHGRRKPADIAVLMGRYMVGSGGLRAKFLLRAPDLCRQSWWDVKTWWRDLRRGTNSYMPEYGFTYSDKLGWEARGFARYLGLRARRLVGSG